MSYLEQGYQWQEPTVLTADELKYQIDCERTKLGIRLDPFNFHRFGGISASPVKEDIEAYCFSPD